MKSGIGWDVARDGRTVRIDINGGWHTRASALLGCVAKDAEFLAERMSTIDSSTTARGAR